MKSKRHFAIMEIISMQRIATQEELCEALKANGFDVTQATVSRDIKELHLLKVPDEKGYHYALPENPVLVNSQERMRRIFQDLVLSIDHSENLVVIRTLPGAAQSVASHIDSAEISNILGTVAGDDTLLIVIKPKEAVPDVIKAFQQLI
ncbi:MAG: arginine repressor [Syntrophomonadaceae bacterium]|jgi:transcriptional regulator of arginine metabolism